jgi:catechol 2,3-dioxygenase-like lactoylglutathione lyase family enzyme
MNLCPSELGSAVNQIDNLETVTLFVEDLPAARSFYEKVFGRPSVYQDDVCTVIRLESVMINLLQASEAPPLLAPVSPAPAGTLPRVMLTIRVADIDSVCEGLATLGVALVNGPINRPWGRRTAVFLDPAGHAWEIAQEL